MNDDDFPFKPKPPSGWHDSAWRRSPQHDKLQADVLKFLRRRRLAGVLANAAVHRTVEGELPIKRRGQIVAYADASEILWINATCTVSLFEIKPRIDSWAAIVRQAKALLELARIAIPGDFHYCHVIVPAADPDLPTLREEWPHTWAWGATFDLPVGAEA